MDGRKNNGGHKTAGRKPKADEQKLVERLSIYENEVHEALKKAAREGQSWAIKLYMDYRYGKPKERKEIDANVQMLDISPISFVYR